MRASCLLSVVILWWFASLFDAVTVGIHGVSRIFTGVIELQCLSSDSCQALQVCIETEDDGQYACVWAIEQTPQIVAGVRHYKFAVKKRVLPAADDRERKTIGLLSIFQLPCEHESHGEKFLHNYRFLKETPAVANRMFHSRIYEQSDTASFRFDLGLVRLSLPHPVEYGNYPLVSIPQLLKYSVSTLNNATLGLCNYYWVRSRTIIENVFPRLFLDDSGRNSKLVWQSKDTSVEAIELVQWTVDRFILMIVVGLLWKMLGCIYVPIKKKKRRSREASADVNTSQKPQQQFQSNTFGTAHSSSRCSTTDRHHTPHQVSQRVLLVNVNDNHHSRGVGGLRGQSSSLPPKREHQHHSPQGSFMTPHYTSPSQRQHRHDHDEQYTARAYVDARGRRAQAAQKQDDNLTVVRRQVSYTQFPVDPVQNRGDNGDSDILSLLLDDNGFVNTPPADTRGPARQCRYT